MAKPRSSAARTRKKSKANQSHPLIQPHAAGIDVGATSLYVAVPFDSADQPVRVFGTFTVDLYALADWLSECRVRTVAMESTGVYWIPLFQVLEERGLEVILVNARHVQNVPGRKSDVQDCQWLQYLHSVGLLRGSFRPPAAICALRSLQRHRENLVRQGAMHIQHMQKALTQMNVLLHNVISELDGLTGLAIVDAILGGEREPKKLAALRHHRIKADEATIVKSLQGDWKLEHLFCLKQSRASHAHCRGHIEECDQQIASLLRQFESHAPDGSENCASSAENQLSPKRKPLRSLAETEKREHYSRILGVDLTMVPGISVQTLQTLFSEIGSSVDRFPTAAHFSSWLGLCPDNRITGGRVLSAATREVKCRTAYALRMAAMGLRASQSTLGEYFRRKRAQLGMPKAITAGAHKLARIIFHLIKNRCPYEESIFSEAEAKHLQRRQQKLKREAASLGFELTPCHA